MFFRWLGSSRRAGVLTIRLHDTSRFWRHIRRRPDAMFPSVQPERIEGLTASARLIPHPAFSFGSASTETTSLYIHCIDFDLPPACGFFV